MELYYGNVSWDFSLVNCIIYILLTNLTKELIHSVCAHLMGCLEPQGTQIGKDCMCLYDRAANERPGSIILSSPVVCALPSNAQQWYQTFSKPTLRLLAVSGRGRFKPSDKQLYAPASSRSVLQILSWPASQILCNCIFSVPGLSGCTFNFQFCFRALSFHQSEQFHLLKCWQIQLLCHFQSIR